jgi:hypothetical protein
MLPLLLETQFVFKVWLVKIPEYSVLFCRIILISALINSLEGPISTSFHAVGKLKLPSLIGGTFQYLTIPIAYIFLKIGYPPQSVFIVQLFIALIMQIAELFILKKLIKYSIIEYLKQVILPVIIVVLISGSIPCLLMTYFNSGFIRFFVVGFTCVITVSLSVYFIGFDREMRAFANKKLMVILKRLKLKKAESNV